MIIAIIICVILLIIFPELFWLLILAVIGGVIGFFIYFKRKKEQEEYIEKKVKESTDRDRQDPTHTHYYKPTEQIQNKTAEIHKQFDQVKKECETYTNKPTEQTQNKVTEIHRQFEQDEKERETYARLNLEYCNSYKNITNDPLVTAMRWGASSLTIFQNCPLVYKYHNISVKHVDRNMLRRMVIAKEYEVTLSISDSDDIDIYRGEYRIGQLGDKIEMCRDWLKKGFPVRCEFVSFQQNAEKVALFFYRDEESKLENHKCDIVKLTSCFSSQKQEAISFLEKGEKLFIDTDDNDKPYLRNIDHEPIGNLPAKYNRAYEDDLISGIYFDHCEPKEGEFDLYDEDRKEIPFVRIYLSE